jgi:hypothetical protein
MAILTPAKLDPTGGGGQATGKRQNDSIIILGMLCDRLIMLCENLITQRPARVSGPPWWGMLGAIKKVYGHHAGNGQ